MIALDLFVCSGFGTNVIIFGVENSSSKHTNNRKKNVLNFGGGSVQVLDDTTIAAEAKYSAEITKSRKDVFSVYTTIQPIVFLYQWCTNLSVQNKGFLNKTIPILFAK